MNSFDYMSCVATGIARLRENLKTNLQRSIDYQNSGTGSRRGCLGNLTLLAEPKSLACWFVDNELSSHKQWAYVAAKINRMIIQMEPGGWFPAYKQLYALLSDHPGIVNWYKQHKVPYFVAGEAEDRDNPKQPAFHGYQAILALNGEWDLLARRCEQILAMELVKDKKYLIDHRFYLALAQGNKSKMEAVLNELTSPKVARIRNVEQAFGLTENLIATHATIYAKIAWWHGYEVEVDSPWVPKEWLPIAPLASYEDPWPFIQSFDIYQSFEGDWASWSPKENA